MAIRERFNRSKDFVAVRRIKLTATKSIEPGDKIVKKDDNPEDADALPRWYLRRLYARRRIGVAGSVWAEGMLADKAARKRPKPAAKPAAKSKPKAESKPKAKVELKL